MSNWNTYYIRFGQYLMLEKSLSKNTIAAYHDDIKKLENYAESFLEYQNPDKFSYKQLSQFIQWIASLNFSATTQARIVSGIKTFYKFLVLENDIKDSPADLLETPKITRKIPVYLSVEEIDKMFGFIDRSTPEGRKKFKYA